MSEIQIKRANKDQLLLLIDAFSKRSIDDLSAIKPIWACGKDIRRLYNQTLHPNAGEYSIQYVFVEEIVNFSDFMGINPFQLFGNGELSDYRVAKIIAQWEGKKHIDPPIIYNCCSNNGKKLAFLDGRHRTVVAFHLKVKQMPVALKLTDRPAIQNIIKLYDLPLVN
jgi:hypothetical protein